MLGTIFSAFVFKLTSNKRKELCANIENLT